ncbi:unnamed protein product [Ectocarpus sp. CCAP 1310/34]|nr:unnamed protein product [Ectocarpus sp. CCAP 1310/34]
MDQRPRTPPPRSTSNLVLSLRCARARFCPWRRQAFGRQSTCFQRKLAQSRRRVEETIQAKAGVLRQQGWPRETIFLARDAAPFCG